MATRGDSVNRTRDGGRRVFVTTTPAERVAAMPARKMVTVAFKLLK